MPYVQMPLKHMVFFWQTMAMLSSQVTKYYSIRILSHLNGKNLLKPLLEYTVNQLFLKIKALWNMNLYRLRQRWSTFYNHLSMLGILIHYESLCVEKGFTHLFTRIHSPMVTPGQIVTFIPIQAFFLIVTFP